MNHIYIIECEDGTLYTGWTNNLEKRLKAHSSGKGAKYTKARLPVDIVYYEEFEDKLFNSYRILPIAFINKNIAISAKITNIFLDGNENLNLSDISK